LEQEAALSEGAFNGDSGEGVPRVGPHPGAKLDEPYLGIMGVGVLGLLVAVWLPFEGDEYGFVVIFFASFDLGLSA
jgi:hypothetical protein